MKPLAKSALSFVLDAKRAQQIANQSVLEVGWL